MRANTFPIITTQTGFDESFLIGTHKELLDFANSIINALDKAKPDTFFGVAARTTNLISTNLDPLSDVKFDWLVITDTQEDKKELFHIINQISRP